MIFWCKNLNYTVSLVNALAMIQSYLSDRKQKCQLGDVMSSERHVTCGIPQGSILGPFLFLLYINDLPECLQKATLRLFADDTNLTVAGESIEEVELAMSNDLHCVHKWMLANKLSLNSSKTEFLLIGSNHRLKNLINQPNIKIDQDKIKQVHYSRLLGVQIDEKLTWNKHVEDVAKKATSGVGAIRRIRDFVDRKTLISIYNALVRPHFEYSVRCGILWALAFQLDYKNFRIERRE